MALTTCVVSGTVKDPAGSAIENLKVSANYIFPIEYSDGTFLAPKEISTTTDSSGAWSLTLVETTSSGVTITISFDFPDGDGGIQRRSYPITVPAQSSAQFSALVS